MSTSANIFDSSRHVAKLIPKRKKPARGCVSAAMDESHASGAASNALEMVTNREVATRRPLCNLTNNSQIRLATEIQQNLDMTRSVGKGKNLSKPFRFPHSSNSSQSSMKNKVIVVDPEDDDVNLQPKKPRAKGVEFNDRAVVTFVNILQEYKLLNGGLHLSNRQWNEIMRRVEPYVPGLRSLRQLKNKYDKLMRTYKEEKDKCSLTGAQPSDWKYFSEMEILRQDCTRDSDLPGAGDNGQFDDDPFPQNSVLDDSHIEMEDPSATFMGTRSEYEEPQFERGHEYDEPLNMPVSPGNDTNTIPRPNGESPRLQACAQEGVTGKPTSKKRSRKSVDEDIAMGINKMADSVIRSESSKLEFMEKSEARKCELIAKIEEMRQANSKMVIEAVATMTKSMCEMTQNTLMQIGMFAMNQKQGGHHNDH